MVRPLLFAETPRAGRWNHRFLVPEDLSMTEEQLAEQAARARQRTQGSDYLAVVRQVEQQEGGRMADEILILQGIAVDHLDAATRRVLVKRLELRLDDLQHLVEVVDWEQEGKRLVVHRRELTQWFDEDFAAELAACRGPAPLDSGSSTTDETAPPARRRWMLPISGCVLLFIALIIWRPWSPADPPPIEREPADASFVNASSVAEILQTESSLRRLAEQWQLPERRDAFPSLCRAVSEKLDKDLAMDSVSSAISAEQRLADLVYALSTHLLRRSQSQTPTLRSQLEDPGFQQRLMSVYAGARLDYAAPLRMLVAPNDYDRQQQLRALQTLCRGETKEQVRGYRQLIEQVKAMTLESAAADELTSDTEMVRRLHDAARISATLRWPAFAGPATTPVAILTEYDAANAMVVLDWLKRAGFSETVGATEAATLAAAQQFVGDKRDLLEVISTQVPPGDRRYAIQCAKTLLALDQHLKR